MSLEDEDIRDLILPLLFTSLAAKKDRKETIVVRVLISGSENQQYVAFKEAADIASSEYGSDGILYEYMDCQHVRKLFEKPSDLVDWILESDIHFILGHIHQGGVIEKALWSVTELYEELMRLRNHLGWPWGSKLNCPILTQNKIIYIRICPSITNPTLDVPIKALVWRDAT
jgi:hypothetical protein